MPISIEEASELLGVSVRRLQQLCKQGRVPRAKQIGRIWMLPSKPRITPGRRGPKLPR